MILIPGLASNSRTEPLMKVIEYWALMHRHDVYCLDTFLGDFLPVVYIQNFFKKYSFKNAIFDEVFKKTAIGINSPHEAQVDGRYTKVSILPTFYDDVEAVDFHPELMDRYGIPITLVASGRDKKSPPEELRKKYNILRDGKNGDLWKMVVFKGSRHSFIDQHKDYDAILRLIQSQKQRASKQTK